MAPDLPEGPPAPPAAPASASPSQDVYTRQRPYTVVRPVDRSERARQSLDRTQREVEEAITGLNQEVKELTARLNRAQAELRRLERVRQALLNAHVDNDNVELELSVPPNRTAAPRDVLASKPTVGEVPELTVPPGPTPAPPISEQRLRAVESKLDRLFKVLDEMKGAKPEVEINTPPG